MGANPRRAVVLACGAVLAAVLVGCPSSKPESPPRPLPPASPTGSPPSGAATEADWPTYHGDPARSGVAARMPAASGRLTAAKVALDGQVYASPVVVAGTVVVATERNLVYGLTTSGRMRWKATLGQPTPRSALPCGNIDPLGITGTPVYDETSGSVFVVASVGSTVRHDLLALDPATGAVRWRRSVDLPGTDPQAMQQRGALAVLGGRVWVPFGGLAGDCGAYKGRLVGVPVGNGAPVSFTVPTTREAGIWTPSGPTVTAGRLFVAVGNGESVGGTYDYSDSVLEVAGDRLVDSFSPDRWASDNRADLDLGSQGPAVVQGRWIFSAGKSGTGYVLRIGHLGGIGGQVSQAPVCASFGGTAVVGDTVYVPCEDGVRAIRITPSGTIAARWRAAGSIAGSPVVGGGRVYAVEADAGILHALDPASGRSLERVAVGVTSRFATPAISGSRLYVPTLSGISIVETAR
jgi:outer membrane protein assembly factor BamB